MFKLNYLKRVVHALICLNNLHAVWLVKYFLVDTDSKKMLLLVIKWILLIVKGMKLIYMFSVYLYTCKSQSVSSHLFVSYSIVRHRIMLFSNLLFFSTSRDLRVYDRIIKLLTRQFLCFSSIWRVKPLAKYCYSLFWCCVFIAQSKVHDPIKWNNKQSVTDLNRCHLSDKDTNMRLDTVLRKRRIRS